MDLPNRRPCITTDVGEGLAVSVSYHPETNEAVEIFVSSRGKKASDGPMTDALYNLGVQVSSIMQNKEQSLRNLVDLLHISFNELFNSLLLFRFIL